MELVAELNPVEQEKKRRRSTERFIGLVVEPAIQKIDKREIQKEEAQIVKPLSEESGGEERRLR